MGLDKMFQALGAGVAPYVAFLVLAAAGVVLVFAWMDKREKNLTDEITAQLEAKYGPQLSTLTVRLEHVEAALNNARPLAADALVIAARMNDSDKLVDILRRLVSTIS